MIVIRCGTKESAPKGRFLLEVATHALICAGAGEGGGTGKEADRLSVKAKDGIRNPCLR